MTLQFIEVPVGEKTATPAVIKQAVRFCRRLREHGIHNYAAPPLIDSAATVCKITVGKRIINIFDEGSCTVSLMKPPSFLFPRGRFDHAAFVAQSHRMHAIYLAMARDSRRLGLKAHARADLNLAIDERTHHERSCPPAL